MTIFQTLKADHKRISVLLKRLNKTSGNNSALRKRFFTQLKGEMIAHARAEEQAVYRSLREKEETRELIFEAFEEHPLVDHLIMQLDTLDPSEETWTAKMTVLKEMIEHHVEEEESDLFKKMRKACDAGELLQMAKAMQTLKKTLKPTVLPREHSQEDIAA